MNISYDYYRIFYYVAKYKNFTVAAKALFNNQPNITRMMKKLEEELGCTLLVRKRHGIALTPEGEKLYAHVSVAFEHITCGEEEIAREKSLQAGIITIASSEIALHCALLPALRTFRSTYPGIRIRIANQTTPQAIDLIKKGLADFAIVTDPFVLPSCLSSLVLQSIQEIPVCSKCFWDSLKIPLPVSFEASLLKNYPLIGLGRQTSSFSFYSEYFNHLGIAYTPDIETASADQLLPLICSDLGIGFVPTDFLKGEKEKNILRLPISPSVPPRNICLIKPKGTSLSIAALELEKRLTSS